MMVKRLPFGSFNGERSQGIDLSGFSVAKFVDRPEETIPWHMHEDAHFFILLKGTYISSAEGIDGCCTPPTVIFVPAGTTHRDRFQIRGGSFLTVSLAPALISRLGGHATLVEQAFGSSSGELPWLGSKIHRELRQSDEVSPIVLEGLALELLGGVVRQRARRRTAESGIRAAFELIHDGYLDKLTVQEIAAAVGVRPQTLARSFRTAFGCSPGEMLRRRRIARAEELLRAGGMPIAEIALASGFADQPQLTKAFRRVTGLTPGGFRKLLSK
jgi:AraC family transcriptional regulator